VWGARNPLYCCVDNRRKLHVEQKIFTLLAVRFQLGYLGTAQETKPCDPHGIYYDSRYVRQNELYQVFDNAQLHIEYVIQLKAVEDVIDK
jgi:hypothetical protein